MESCYHLASSVLLLASSSPLSQAKVYRSDRHRTINRRQNQPHYEQLSSIDSDTGTAADRDSDTVDGADSSTAAGDADADADADVG